MFQLLGFALVLSAVFEIWLLRKLYVLRDVNRGMQEAHETWKELCEERWKRIRDMEVEHDQLANNLKKLREENNRLGHDLQLAREQLCDSNLRLVHVRNIADGLEITNKRASQWNDLAKRAGACSAHSVGEVELTEFRFWQNLEIGREYMIGSYRTFFQSHRLVDTGVPPGSQFKEQEIHAVFCVIEDTATKDQAVQNAEAK